MRCNVKEEILVLRRRVLRSMWPRVTHHHHHRLFGVLPFGPAKEGDGVVGDEVGKVILFIIESVTDFFPVDVHRVIVESRISDQTFPLVPSLRHMIARVFVQILAEVA